MAALRDLQEQLAVSENEAVDLRRQLDVAKATTKNARQDAESEKVAHSLEISKLRQLVLELKDELQQSVQVRC